MTQTRAIAEAVGEMIGFWVYSEARATDISGRLGEGERGYREESRMMTKCLA